MAFGDRTWRWIVKEALGSAHTKNEKDVLKISAGYTSKGIMPATASTTAVVNAAATSPTGATTVTSGITNPDVSRNLTVVGSTSTAAGYVVVTGKNVEGKVISEGFTLNGTTTVTGNMAFKSVSQVAIPTQVGVGITVSVGTGNKLGLHHRLEPGLFNIRTVIDTTSSPLSIDNHAFDAQPTVTTSDYIELNTAAPVTAPDGAHFYRFYYILYFWSLDNQEGKEQYTTTTSTSSTSSSTSTTTLTTSTSVSSTSTSSTSSSTSSTSTSHSTSSTSTSTSTLP